MLREKLHERSQPERANQRAQSDQPAQQVGKQGTQCIGKHAAAEVGERQPVRHHQRKCVIGRNAQIRCLVQRTPEGNDQHADSHPEQLDGQGVGRTEGRRHRIAREGDNEADAKAVDDGAQPNIPPPPNQLRYKQKQVHKHILNTERHADQFGQPQIQCADGVVAQMGELENCNADADDDDTRYHAQNAPCADFLIQNAHMQNIQSL